MDPYRALGIPESATQEEIKKAYRRLAMEFHPDRNNSPGAEEQFKRVSEAYSLIGTEQSRKEYERSQRGPFPHPGGGFNPFEDFFRSSNFSGDSWEDLFGNHRRRRAPYVIRAQLEVSLEDMLSESVKSFTLDGQTVDFRIPKGIRPNQTVRIPIQSGQELHLSIAIARHNIFSLDGDDLYTRITVPVETALRGGEVSVPTLSGTMILKVPARTNSHSKLRVKAAGLPKAGGGAGSIIYEVAIDVKKLGNSLSEWVTSS